MNFVQRYYELLKKILWTSYKVLMNISKSSHALLTNYLLPSCVWTLRPYCEHLVNFSITSYDNITNIVKYEILESIQMSKRTYSLLCIFSLPPQKETSIKSSTFYVAWSSHDFDHALLLHDTKLVNFHHVTWSHQAAMILRMSTGLFCKGLNIKGLMLLKGLSILEIYSDWMQACLIYIVWSTQTSH